MSSGDSNSEQQHKITESSEADFQEDEPLTLPPTPRSEEFVTVAPGASPAEPTHVDRVGDYDPFRKLLAVAWGLSTRRGIAI